MYKEIDSCYTCKKYDYISDDILICCNKKSEKYNKEVSKFGSCEFYEKILYREKSLGSEE